MSRQAKSKEDGRGAEVDLSMRHMRFGWWSLLFFLAMGIVLEALHALKAGFYLDVSNEVRRLMWTLAHSHGALLALIHIAFALTLRDAPKDTMKRWRFASPCLCSATIFLPGGFFLGGLFIYDGDPGLGVLFVPVGALLLLIGVWRTATLVGVKRTDSPTDTAAPRTKRRK